METQAMLTNMTVSDTTKSFLAKYTSASDASRPALLAGFISDTPRISSGDAHLVIQALLDPSWAGPSVQAKFALANLLCKFPVPAEASFLELYQLHILLFHRLRHNGIHTYLFGIWEHKNNYGINSPMVRALRAPALPDDHHGADTLEQARRLLHVSKIPGAHMLELFTMLGYAFASHMPMATQQPLFGRRAKMYPLSVRVLPGKVSRWVDLQVHFTPPMFQKLLTEHLLEPMDEFV